MFNKNVAAITKQFGKMLAQLDAVVDNTTARIYNSEDLIRAANDFIAEQKQEREAAEKISKNIRKLIGE